MKFYERINNIALDLTDIKTKLESIAIDFISEAELIEYYKIMNLVDFNIATLVEFSLQDNVEYLKSNKDFVKDVLNNIESFVKDVNDNLNI